MPANTVPIFSRLPDIQWIGYMTAANTTADLTSGTSYNVFTSDSTNGVNSLTVTGASHFAMAPCMSPR